MAACDAKSVTRRVSSAARDLPFGWDMTNGRVEADNGLFGYGPTAEVSAIPEAALVPEARFYHARA